MEGDRAESREAGEGTPAGPLCVTGSSMLTTSGVRAVCEGEFRRKDLISSSFYDSDFHEIPGHQWTKFAAREMT